MSGHLFLLYKYNPVRILNGGTAPPGCILDGGAAILELKGGFNEIFT